MRTEKNPKQNGSATNTPHPDVPGLCTPRYLASAPNTAAEPTAKTPLPTVSGAINEAPVEESAVAGIAGSTREGTSLSSRKNAAFPTGRKKKNTSQRGRPVSL